MYSSNSEIRSKARAMLGNGIFARNWLMIVLMISVISIIVGAANYIGCGLGSLLLSGPLYIGLYNVLLNMSKGEEDIRFESVFEGCYKFGPNLVLGVMHTLIIMLWSLLFIIPGIIRSYSLSLAYYIRNDHPEYTWRQCLDASEQMMQGHKWRLFKLHFSFLGWTLLSVLTLGIGSIWVTAYKQTATTVFYEDLKANSMYL